MIEFCTKRRMIISVVGLGILTLLILVLEEALTPGPISYSPTPYSTNQSLHEETHAHPKSVILDSETSDKVNDKPCWLVEAYAILEECSACTGFEINSQSTAACSKTGLKEKLQCKVSGIFAFRSCSSVKAVEQRNFIFFMFSMLLLFVLSVGAVKARTSQLQRKTVKNIEKRLAAGQ